MNTCLEGKSFQFDRVDEENLIRRIKARISAIFCSVFDRKDQLVLLRVYEVKPTSLYKILSAKYKKSSLSSRHVGITEKELQPLVESGEAELIIKNQSE